MHTLQFCVALDIADVAQKQQLAEYLEFAEIQVTEDLYSADVVLGDGKQAHQFSGYVYVQNTPQDISPGISATTQLGSILAAISKAMSQDASDKTANDPVFSSFVGTSDAAVNIRQAMAKAARTDVTVLVTGESGTGKEVVARTLHAGSQRAQGPFVPINCGAIPAELLESELFGHERGAFTGAITQKTGRFELAHGGTLFLDEIGDLPYAMQVKLLRAIEQKSFERIGSTQTRVADVRILAATNKNLEEKIESGEFREDLYYRLNVFPIELNPLRERQQDMELLISVLLEKIQRTQKLNIRLSLDAVEALKLYGWPGNVRELDNLLQRLCIQYPNNIVKTSDLPKKFIEQGASNVSLVEFNSTSTQPEPSEILLPVNGIDLKDYLTRLEKSLIQQALDDTNSVVARAADRLQIRRTTLVEKMRKHGLGRMENVQ